MGQLLKGETFSNGEQVTALRLNQLVDSATLTTGAITEQANMSPNTLAVDDSLLAYDTSANGLREITASDVLNSGLPITTGSITGNSGSNLIITASSGNSVSVSGSTTITGLVSANGGISTTNITSTTDITSNGTASFTGNATFSANANFTGTLQVNGSTAYVLTEIYEETIPTYIAAVGGQANNIYTSAQFTKPAGEIWVMEMQAVHSGKGGYSYEFAVRYGSQTPTTGSYIGYERVHDGQGGGAHCVKLYLNRWVFQSATTFTNETIRVDCTLGNGSEFQFAPTVWQYSGFVANIMATPSKFRIYKYKTA